MCQYILRVHIIFSGNWKVYSKGFVVNNHQLIVSVLNQYEFILVSLKTISSTQIKSGLSGVYQNFISIGFQLKVVCAISIVIFCFNS